LLGEDARTTIRRDREESATTVDVPQIQLLLGDAYRCERELAEREAAILSADPDCERRALFGDEIDPASFEIELRSASLFALGRHFVVRQVDRSKAAKGLAKALEGESAPGTYVTLLAPELRGTNPVLKLCKSRDAVVSAPTPKGRGVQAAAREILSERGLDASSGAVGRLVFRSGGDLLGVSQEADKLRTFALHGEVTEETIDEVVFPGAEGTVFPFFDRLGERDLAGALATLRELRDDPGRTLGGAIRHLARLAMIRAVLDQKGPRRRLTMDELTRALEEGLRLDGSIKRGNTSPEDALLELVFAVARSA
jgi:DNA polymerase III delta subunit